MDAVRNDPGHGPAIGAFAQTRQQGCGDFQAQASPAATATHLHNPASTHNPFAHNTRMTSPLITAALTGIPPSPAGDGSPGYNALFADTPYDFVGDGRDRRASASRASRSTARLRRRCSTGCSGVLPADADQHERPAGPGVPSLPTAFLPVCTRAPSGSTT